MDGTILIGHPARMTATAQQNWRSEDWYCRATNFVVVVVTRGPRGDS